MCFLGSKLADNFLCRQNSIWPHLNVIRSSPTHTKIIKVVHCRSAVLKYKKNPQLKQVWIIKVSHCIHLLLTDLERWCGAQYRQRAFSLHYTLNSAHRNSKNCSTSAIQFMNTKIKFCEDLSRNSRDTLFHTYTHKVSASPVLFKACRHTS